MARRAYKRRSSRKSTRRSKKRRYTRRYKRRAKSKTAKLWKYVKKATKSEIKRCDIMYPPNPSYSPTAFQGGGTSAIVRPMSKILFQMVFKNNGIGNNANWADTYPNIYIGTNRFWYPYQLGFNIAKGPASYERVGDKIYAKYINFKIHFRNTMDDVHPHYCSLYFVQIKRSVSAAFNVDNVIDALWEGVADFCRAASPQEIYAYNNSDAYYEQLRSLMSQSYCQRRKRYLKGIKMRKLHSSHSNVRRTTVPYYQLNANAGWSGAALQGNMADTSVFTLTQSETTNQVDRHHTFAPTGQVVYAPDANVKNTYFSVLVPINKEWKYDVNQSAGGYQLDEYKYFLVAICSDFIRDATASTTRPATMEYFVSGELVYTDK